ncbi:MAG: hypothetical protein QNJ55_28665 [Xenococcus sp. MO_188.B8]|nr:hypothetical protein [Xenococcus sp. MO_188.B8]
MAVDLIPLSQLPSRYDIARSNLYNRLKDLKIEPIKQGRKAFVNEKELKLLDQLHAHLQEGGVTSDLIKQQDNQSYQLVTDSNSEVEQSLPVSVQSQNEPTITLQPTALISVVEAVVKRFIPTSTSRLTYLRELEEAYQNSWLLSTSEVANLLGLAQKTITSYGQEFSDAGFVFTRVGMRKRGEIAWAIDKQSSDWNEQLPSSTKNIKEAFSEAFDP